MTMPLTDHIADIELATNAHDMREPIARALESLADNLDDLEIDSVPTANSNNLVESNGVYQMWSDLVDAETFLLPTDQVILGEKNITEPGTYIAYDDGFDGYSHVEVNESAGRVTANLKPKYIYRTGTYRPEEDDCDGYSEVHVETDNSSLASVVNRTINEIDPDNSIDRIGPYAFYSCNQLRSVSFPVCTAVESHAFEACALLNTISASMCTEISDYAFAFCSNLSNTAFSDLSYIPEGAFLSCVSLPYYDIKYHSSMSILHHIASKAFANCYNFQGFGYWYPTVQYSEQITITNYIGDYAFYNCSSYRTETRIIPYDIFPLLPLESQIDITIGKCAFENCINLSQFNIALFEATSLAYAQIKTVRIQESAFKNCINLARFHIFNQDANYNIEQIIIESNAFENCNNFTDVNDASSVYWNELEIHEAAFRNVNRLPIPLRNVTYIGKYAVQNLLQTSALSSHILTIYSPGESTALIDNYAFKNAYISIANLHSCYLNSMAFANCQSLSFLQLYGDCSFANYAFDNCLNLSTIYIETSSVAISEHTFANTYLDLYSTISDVNDKPFEPQILIRSQYFSIYASNAAWSKYLSYMKSGDIY